MNYNSNENKPLKVSVDSNTYIRHAIITHYIKPKESYIDIVNEYVEPITESGDIICISEKIIALSQNRVVYKKDIKVGFFAKFLSRFVNVTPAGEAVGNPFKMQLAIMQAGLPRILLAAGVGAIGKLIKKKGLFYIIAGNGINGIDGFCDDAFADYLEMGILNPINCNQVCNDIEKETGITCVIVDANDLGIEVLGHSDNLHINIDTIKKIIKDNPAGQGNQQTPIILIRKDA